MRLVPPVVGVALLLMGGCSRVVNTLPPLARPDAPPSEITFEIPANLEVRSVDYDASMFSNVSGTSGDFGSTSTSVGGRAFVKVYAVHRSSGEQVLLVHENIFGRTQPVQIIRFRSAPVPAPVDSARTRTRPDAPLQGPPGPA